ncbi:MAG: hypothetical protein IPM23_16495 [Candidatus Melainabacteria bacterium]|nr:hypothetical protein [Candidatus Melainabacteria bacterium]
MSSNSRMCPWLADLLDKLNAGCARSPFIVNLEQSAETLSTGRKLCLTLWPFISDLPANVQAVRDKLPGEMVHTRQLFDHLSDGDLYYQGLYLKQCQLAGLEREELLETEPEESTAHLTGLMTRYCKTGDLRDGIFAIVTAELAATTYARHSYPFFEHYFEANPQDCRIDMEEGLAWLKLHARPNTRHAIWIKRTIDTLNVDPPNEMPEQVEKLLEAIYGLWQLPGPRKLTGAHSL